MKKGLSARLTGAVQEKRRQVAAGFTAAALAFGVGYIADPASAEAAQMPVSVAQAGTQGVDAPRTTPPQRLSPAAEKAAMAAADAKAQRKIAKAQQKYGAKAVVKGAPERGGASSAAAKSGSGASLLSVNYFYVTAQSTAASPIAGGVDNVSIRKPFLNSSDYHTLAELAVHDATQQNVVEVGWTVDPVVNGNSNPHLFVFNWVGGTPGCYNGCGFVPYGTGVQAGDDLNAHVGTSKFMEIQHFSGAWWIRYDVDWIGYFPDSDWPGSTFTSITETKVFGEVAASTATPCTDMGNGILGNSANSATAAKLGSYAQVPNVGTNVLTGPSRVPNTIPNTRYDGYALSARTFVYGGPGWNAAGTAAGTTGSC